MTTNARVDDRHIKEAHQIDDIALPRKRVSIYAQTLANLEAANNRLAAIDRLLRAGRMNAESAIAMNELLISIERVASGHTPSQGVDGLVDSAIRSAHSRSVEHVYDITPSPCPGCAAKDEAMANIAGLVAEDRTAKADRLWLIGEIAARFIIPPADPAAEALKAILERVLPPHHWEGLDLSDALAELKSRLPLGGA